jgi:hypothetical protein
VHINECEREKHVIKISPKEEFFSLSIYVLLVGAQLEGKFFSLASSSTFHFLLHFGKQQRK